MRGSLVHQIGIIMFHSVIQNLSGMVWKNFAVRSFVLQRRENVTTAADTPHVDHTDLHRRIHLVFLGGFGQEGEIGELELIEGWLPLWVDELKQQIQSRSIFSKMNIFVRSGRKFRCLGKAACRRAKIGRMNVEQDAIAGPKDYIGIWRIDCSMRWDCQ